MALLLLTWFSAGCIDDPGRPAGLEQIWGRRGALPGHLQKPRAIALDDRRDAGDGSGERRDGEIYLVDMTARIQVFDLQGQYLRGWQTPASETGKPSGLSIGRDGNLLVADTHYFRMLVYSPQGELLDGFCIGGTEGHGPGEFGFVTDAVQDSQGNYYISEYGEYDRIQKFSPQGRYLLEWGGHGPELGQFRRPQNLAVDQQDRIWVADACNHRIQVFDGQGKLLSWFGSEGAEPGQLRYPYDLCFDPDEQHLYVVEYGNHRVQKFTLDGRSVGIWGTHGRGPGQMHNPWGLAADSDGKIYVLDTNNHRVQMISL